MPKSNARKKKAPKRVLALPDLEHAKTAVLNSLTSASGQRTYDHAIREFVAWYCSEPRLAFNRTVVLRYRIHLEHQGYAPATINLRLAAVRRIAYEAADAGLLSPQLAAGIRRVKGVRHRCASRELADAGPGPTASRVRDAIDDSRIADHAMVAMLLGCGLRRAELLALRLDSIQTQEEHWVIADLVGKAGHVRTVPNPDMGEGRSRRLDNSGRDQPWPAPASTSSLCTICDAPVPVCAIWRVANLTRSSSSWAMSPSRRRSATSDASRSSGWP
jgi:integrase